MRKFTCESCQTDFDMPDAMPPGVRYACECGASLVEVRDFTPRNLDTIPVEEKVRLFDAAYKTVLHDFQQLQNHGETSEDAQYYTWEAVMSWLGVGVFDAYNKLLR